MRSYQNLKVVFYLNSEMIIPRYPIPFDALLMKAAAIKSDYPLDESALLYPVPELPVERHSVFPDLYLASVGFIAASGRNEHFFTKRYHGDLPPKVDISGGFFKAYHLHLYSLSCPAMVTFYCRGDAEAIADLVSCIPALGPKRSQGYGKVRNVTVEVIGEDRSWIHESQPMRAIPVRYYMEKINVWYYTAMNPIPPSYTASQTELCYLPSPSAWLMFPNHSMTAETVEEQVSKLVRKKTKGFRKVWGEWEME